jgi:thymidylate synthase (FAD)
MKGSVRSWIHYLEVRRGNGTQLEHIDLADKIHVLFEEEFPLITQAVKELEMENV